MVKPTTPLPQDVIIRINTPDGQVIEKNFFDVKFGDYPPGTKFTAIQDGKVYLPKENLEMRGQPYVLKYKWSADDPIEYT